MIFIYSILSSRSSQAELMKVYDFQKSIKKKKTALLLMLKRVESKNNLSFDI